MPKNKLFIPSIVFICAVYSPTVKAQSEHCLQFTDTSNQLCVTLAGEDQAEIRFKSLGETNLEIAKGKLHFVTWSRADKHTPFEVPPPDIRNLAPPGWGRETINGLIPIRFALIGIGNQVIWVRDNGLIAKFPVDPAKVERIDYSSPNEQDLPAAGADALHAQLTREYYQTYTILSRCRPDSVSQVQRYIEDHFLMRFSDGYYLHFGPFPGNIRAVRVPILKDYSPLTRGESMGLSLGARVGMTSAQYEIDLENFWAMLTSGKEEPSVPRIIRPNHSDQIIPDAVRGLPPATQTPFVQRDTLTLEEFRKMIRARRCAIALRKKKRE